MYELWGKKKTKKKQETRSKSSASNAEEIFENESLNFARSLVGDISRLVLPAAFFLQRFVENKETDM